MPFYIPQYLDIVSEQELISILNEQYFQNKNLTIVEQKIGELRKKYMYKSATKINTDPLVLEISELFAQAFGFNSFQLVIEPSKFPNAYTIPLSSKVDAYSYKKCVRKSSDGLQFTPIAKVNIVAHITTALFLNDKYTDREIVAVLLHEIGHNFSDSLDNILGFFSIFKKIFYLPLALLYPFQLTNTGQKIATNVTNKVRKDAPTLVSIYNAIKIFNSTVQYVSVNISQFLAALGSPYFSINVVSMIRNILTYFTGRQDEYMSDSFAAMYGYGPELASSLNKMERTNTAVDEVFKETEFGAIYYAVIVESQEYISSILYDNHPSNAARLLNVLDLLKKEYDKPYINAKTKKAIAEDIKEIEDMIKEEEENNSFDGNMWRIAWNKFVYSHKKNKGPKDKLMGKVLQKIENLPEIEK